MASKIVVEKKWQNLFAGSKRPFCGYVKTVEDAMALIREFELETTSKFSTFKGNRGFGSSDPFAKSRKIYFQDVRVPFDGTPFIITAIKVFDCQHGPDRKTAQKAQMAQAKHDDHTFKKKRFLPQNTKKFDCQAEIKLHEVIKFKDIKAG